MAAYAALVSVMHIIEHIQHHPRPPISLDKKQVESLTEKVTFLQYFLEGRSHGGSEEEDSLESRIADAAYAAEDVIESHIVDQILSGSTSHGEVVMISSTTDLYQGLQKVIEDMDLIKKEVMEIKGRKGTQDQLHQHSMPTCGLSRFPPTEQNTMVGFDDVLNEMMDKLTGQRSDCHIIPIVGMGGIGKTTLARNIYVHSLIVQHFDILAWVTVSQEYSVREILVHLLLCLKTQGGRETYSQVSEEELGIMIHKSLSGRRYLIIMDDIWSVEAWDKVKLFFPDNNNRSRIIITTRLSNMASQLAHPHDGLEMKLLDEDRSWNLLCKTVFGDQEGCPDELEEIAKKIAKNCNGLPLSIAVIGGILAKSKQTQEYCEYIAENLNSIVNLEDNERCLKILQMSYNQLPVYLKSCFLYMGVFPEDRMIRVSLLIKLWVAEGFLKPNGDNSLEVVAEAYIRELIDRNLILACEWRSNGKIKSCNMHDLLRDLCSKQAEKEKFLCVIREHRSNIPQGMNTQRRIGIHKRIGPEDLDDLQTASLARSLICDWECKGLPSLNHRLLRVLKATDKHLSGFEDKYYKENIFQLVNLRFFDVPVNYDRNLSFPSSVYLFWNIQTFISMNNWDAVTAPSVTAPSEIWKMPQLRHVQFNHLALPNPCRDDFVLGNLQTLSIIRNFKCSESVVKRIPNIKKLKISYWDIEDDSDYCLHNLSHLHKLESFACQFNDYWVSESRVLMQNISFPHSLQKLILYRTKLHWEDMRTKIGSLPHLEVLKLKAEAFIGPEWETVEGQFLSLKFLKMEWCPHLERWMTEDSTHFPRLERVVLFSLYSLKEIPWAIGDIPTLQSIQLKHCSDSAVISARGMLEEQEELGNLSLQVLVELTSRAGKNVKALKKLESPNFKVDFSSKYKFRG